MQIVRLGPDDWRRWRVLRLAALAQAPEAFGSTLAEWTGTGDTEERWRYRLEAVPYNLVLAREGHDTAMASLTRPDGADSPELISMWVAPRDRGTGAADTVVAAILAVAAETYPGRPVALSVYQDNDAARRLYVRHGFVGAGPSPEGEGELRMVHRG